MPPRRKPLLKLRRRNPVKAGKAVVGLGNPGPEYGVTRHNVGFQVIDLYRREHIPHRRGRITCSSIVYRNDDLLLVKPLTYMNESGAAVRQVIVRFGLNPSAILIVYDDLDLPLGRMRILPKGGPGTHKGMRSIVAALGTEDIPRLRIGIGVADRAPDTVDFVLSRFSADEWRTIVPVFRQAAKAIELFRTATLDTVMNQFNRHGVAPPPL